MISHFKNKYNTLIIDAIKSRMYPDIVLLKTMLDLFENSNQFVSYDFSDLVELMLRNTIDTYVKILSISKKSDIYFFWFDDFEEIKDSPIEYPNILSWAVFEVFWHADTNPISIEDVPIIRRMLNVPAGKEQEMLDEWQAYWAKIDFETRKKLIEQEYIEI